MKRLFIPLAFLFLFIISAACNSPQSGKTETENSPDDISKKDKEFMAIASSAGIMEVELGKLATAKATQPEIVKYGEMMVQEHTKVNEEFKEMLQRLQVTVPPGMPPRNAQMVKEHEALTGAAFDKKYVQTMIDDHQFATEKFKEALADARNEDYKKFLTAMIPIVEMHHKMALDLQQKLN